MRDKMDPFSLLFVFGKNLYRLFFICATTTATTVWCGKIVNQLDSAISIFTAQEIH